MEKLIVKTIPDEGFQFLFEKDGINVSSAFLSKEEASVLILEIQKILNETAVTKHLEQV